MCVSICSRCRWLLFSIFKDGKCTNFIQTMNVFSLAVCFPIFDLQLLSSCLESWSNWRAKNVGGRVSAWEQKRKLFLKTIGNLVTWPAPNARFLFARNQFPWKTVKNSNTWPPPSNQDSRNYLIYFDTLLFLLREQVSFGSYFSRVFSPRALCRLV